MQWNRYGIYRNIKNTTKRMLRLGGPTHIFGRYVRAYYLKPILEADINSDSHPQGNEGDVEPGLEWLKDALNTK